MVGCLYLLSFISQLNAGDPCLARDFGHSSIVCVCNRTYCDTYDTVQGKYSTQPPPLDCSLLLQPCRPSEVSSLTELAGDWRTTS